MHIVNGCEVWIENSVAMVIFLRQLYLSLNMRYVMNFKLNISICSQELCGSAPLNDIEILAFGKNDVKKPPKHSDVICNSRFTPPSRFKTTFPCTGQSHGNSCRVCKKNRIHHWCSLETVKSQPKGSPFKWETRLCRVFPVNPYQRVGIYCLQ